MKNQEPFIHQQIAEIYLKYRDNIVRYIYQKTGNQMTAEDLSHDVFVRLIECKQLLHESTIHSFVYKIAYHITVDYLRRYHCRKEIYKRIHERTPRSSNDNEENAIVNDLLGLEQYKLSSMPKQRKRIYQMYRIEDRSISEIAETLNLSKRSVGNHILLGRKEMRRFLRNCM